MPVRFKDDYDVLAVAQDASSQDITKAFCDLARMYHRDVVKDKKRVKQS